MITKILCLVQICYQNLKKEIHTKLKIQVSVKMGRNNMSAMKYGINHELRVKKARMFCRSLQNKKR